LPVDRIGPLVELLGELVVLIAEDGHLRGEGIDLLAQELHIVVLFLLDLARKMAYVILIGGLGSLRFKIIGRFFELFLDNIRILRKPVRKEFKSTIPITFRCRYIPELIPISVVGYLPLERLPDKERKKKDSKNF